MNLMPTTAIMGYRRWRDWRWTRHPKQFNGYVLYGHPVGPGWESEEQAAIESALDDVDVCVDVGANIGFYTCLFRSRGKQVISFEPLRRNLDFLYRNLDANRFTDVEVFPVALGSKVEIGRITGVAHIASLVPDWSRTSSHHSELVPVLTLDGTARLAGRRAFIKIDAEGYELEVLCGSLQTLRANPRPIWLVEVLERNPNGTENPDFDETVKLFTSLGYSATRAGSGFLFK